MSNIHTPSSAHRFISIGCMTLGLTLLLIGSEATSQAQDAQVTHQGATVLERLSQPVEIATLEQAHGAAMPEERESVDLLILLGMLFVLIGLGLHAYIVIHSEHTPHEHKPIKVPVRRASWQIFWMRF